MEVRDKMRTERKMRCSTAVLVFASLSAAQGQVSAAPAGSGPRVLVSSSGAASAPAQMDGEVVREIDDPHTGDRWLLVRDRSHPGGPGRLVLVAGVRIGARRDRAAVEPSPVELRPVIRAGERLIVEENTPVVEARLEAVALGPAVIGSPLDVRLRIGGRVVRAVALAPGRASLQPETGVRP